MAPPIGVNISERQANLAQVIDLFPGRHQPSLLGLVTALQTTLELEPLLRIFSGEIRPRIEHQGMTYRDQRRGIVLAIGRGGRHRCGYRLNLFQMDLGELTFSRPTRFSDEEIRELEQLVCHLIYPLRNALSYLDAVTRAHRDPLTGIGNRAAFDEALAREIQLTRRHGTPFALLACDVDLFKLVNDRFGHAAGDRVLQRVTEAIRSAVRESDLLYRYGGEEFMVLLSNTDSAGAALVAERIREAVAAASGLELPGVTISVGVALCGAEESAQQLFERADAALYRAKDQGRDRVVMAEMN